MLTYQQTLDKVEKFQIKSGIRNHCEKICKGQCCDSRSFGYNCFVSNPEACHRIGERRLACSVFVCGEIQRFFSKKDQEGYQNFQSIIFRQIVEKLKLEGLNKYIKALPYENIEDFYIAGSDAQTILSFLEHFNYSKFKKMLEENVIDGEWYEFRRGYLDIHVWRGFLGHRECLLEMEWPAAVRVELFNRGLIDKKTRVA